MLSVLAIAVIAGGLSLLLTLVAAPRYEPIFVAIVVCNVLVVVAIFFVAKTKLHRAWIAGLALIVIYTGSDVALRYFAGARLFE